MTEQKKTRRQLLEDFVAKKPDDAFSRYGLAMEFVSEANDADAVREFRELFAVAPKYVPAYHQAGQAFLRLNRMVEAREVLRQGIDMAMKQGDQHAAAEMEELLAGLG